MNCTAPLKLRSRSQAQGAAPKLNNPSKMNTTQVTVTTVPNMNNNQIMNTPSIHDGAFFIAPFYAPIVERKYWELEPSYSSIGAELHQHNHHAAAVVETIGGLEV